MAVYIGKSILDIRQLTYFMYVVDLGSFSRAAAFLHIAQPALSRQISSLETELEQRLLIRNGRGVLPTEAGSRLLGHARMIIQLFERAQEDMENARLGRTASVAIGMPGSLANPIGTDLLRRLHAELPDAKVHVLTGRSTQLQEWLLSGRLDLAVLFDAPKSPMLDIDPLFDDHLHLFEPRPDGKTGGEGPPITLQELANHPLIITSRPNRVREILEAALTRVGRKLLVACELDSLETTFDMVRDGTGRTVASNRTRRRLRTTGGASLWTRRIIDPELILTVQIVRRTRRLNSSVVDTAFEILREVSLATLPD